MPHDGLSWIPLLRRDASAPVAGDPAHVHKDVGSAVVDCGVYDEGHRQGGVVELETALRKADACQDGFVWIGLHDPSPEVVEAVGKRFELHPLAVEDARQRPPAGAARSARPPPRRPRGWGRGGRSRRSRRGTRPRG